MACNKKIEKSPRDRPRVSQTRPFVRIVLSFNRFIDILRLTPFGGSPLPKSVRQSRSHIPGKAQGPILKYLNRCSGRPEKYCLAILTYLFTYLFISTVRFVLKHTKARLEPKVLRTFNRFRRWKTLVLRCLENVSFEFYRVSKTAV